MRMGEWEYACRFCGKSRPKPGEIWGIDPAALCRCDYAAIEAQRLALIREFEEDAEEMRILGDMDSYRGCKRLIYHLKRPEER